MNMHTDAKMPHFKGKKKWGILASVCIFMQATYLCHSHFGGILATLAYLQMPSRNIFRPNVVEIVNSYPSIVEMLLGGI